jgi:hypothetical protein
VSVRLSAFVLKSAKGVNMSACPCCDGFDAMICCEARKKKTRGSVFGTVNRQ